jgi:hypothetical protein
MRAGAAFALLACAAAGTAFTLTRAVTLAREPVPVTTHGMCAPVELLGRERLTYPANICAIELPDDGWRPLRIDIALRRGSGAAGSIGGAGNATTRVSVNSGTPVDFAVAERWTTHHVDVPPRLTDATRITLRLEVPPAAATPDGAPPFQIGRIDVTRELTTARMLRDGLAGAFAAIVLWWLISRSRLPLTPLAPRSPRGAGGNNVAVGASPTAGSPTPSTSRDSVAARNTRAEEMRASPSPPATEHRDSVAARKRRQPWRGAIGLAAVLFLYFVLWALLRPPYQTPDEVQHHLRATSVLRHPWVAGAGEWTLDPRFTNPLALWTPPSLDKLFFDTSERLTLAEIAALERIPWPAADGRPGPETFQRAIASYPTLYYWPVFLLGEGLTRGLHLSPYQSTYAYRIVSAALAAILWGAVYLVMRRVLSPDADADASTNANDTSLTALLVGFLVLNPMVPFMSSGINPDAVNVPLATLSILLVWQVMSTGAGARLACLALVATALTKPSGLQMIPAFAAAGAALWALGHVTFERLRLAAATIGVAAAIAWCGFYAWSPPRFVGGPPIVARWPTYLTTRWLELPWTWQTYWGTLGWLEYTAPVIWYHLLAALTVISLFCVLLRPRAHTPRLFAGYAAIFLVAFLAVTLAGEFFYLPTAGYFLQGRHLLPASLGLTGLMWHRVRPVRLAFLAVLIVMNVLLLHQTVLRYYTRGWSAVVSALPFAGASGANTR